MDLRTRLVYQLAKSRLKTIDASVGEEEAVQKRQLERILSRAERTEMGRRYDLSRRTSHREFASRVPIIDYEGCKADIERMISGEQDVLTPGVCRWFAKSSGTTSDKSKFIPVPYLHLHDCHYRGGSDALWLYLRTREDSRFFAHRGLVLGGSHSPVALGQGKSRAGDLSSILVEHMPSLGSWIRTPSKKTLLMSEWTSKMSAIVEEVSRQSVASLSGVPSWMMVMIGEVLRHTGRETLTEVWGDLEVFFHGGISFEPYREQYRQLIPSDRMRYVETYNASEGFIAIQDDPAVQAMRLMVDYGVFYEFIPLDALTELEEGIYDPSPAVPLWEVELGRTYALVMTSLGGLYRYLIGDTVRFVSKSPYRLEIVGRTKHYINAFGEELMVSNADTALRKACAETGASVRDYTVAPRFADTPGKGWHEWLVEFATEPADVEVFARLLDEELQRANSDYEAKRYSDMTLLPLRLVRAERGLFEHWLQGQGKLGGQHKVPRLSNKPALLDELLRLNSSLSQRE